jgi:Fe-S-cluster containining protein
MNSELKQRVLQVYADVDAAIAAANPRCDASGRCCRFTEYGHTLFLSHFEAEILLDTAPPFAKPVTRDGCPFQVNNLCTARDERPLGCRVYFCDPNFQEPQFTITEAAIAKLKRLADEYDTGWRYAPLHVFLNEADRPQDSDGSNADAPPPSRMSLPVVASGEPGPRGPRV